MYKPKPKPKPKPRVTKTAVVDPLSLALNASSNLARQSKDPLITGVYDKLTGVALRQGMSGKQTHPFMRGVFNASLLSQPFDPVMAGEDLGVGLRRTMRKLPEPARKAMVGQLQAALQHVNIQDIPSEYRSVARVFQKSPAEEILQNVARETKPGRFIPKTLASKRDAQRLGNVVGGFGHFGVGADIGSINPWNTAAAAVTDEIPKIPKKGITEIAKGNKPTWRSSLIKGLVEGGLEPKASPKTFGQHLAQDVKSLAGLTVPPAMRSVVEQAQFAQRTLQEGQQGLVGAAQRVDRSAAAKKLMRC